MIKWHGIVLISKMPAILKFFNRHLHENRVLDWTETLWKASGQDGDLDLLKPIHSNIQDGQHGGHHILQMTYPSVLYV